jgi:hypothetical protein
MQKMDVKKRAFIVFNFGEEGEYFSTKSHVINSNHLSVFLFAIFA